MADEQTKTTDEQSGVSENTAKTAGDVDPDELKEEMKKIEEDPPKNLEDWPDGPAKYETMGGVEGTHTYEEGPEKNLGPSGVRHHEDGTVEVDGEKVDNPEDYKGDPIPGGPTDPDAPDSVKSREDKKRELEERRGDES